MAGTTIGSAPGVVMLLLLHSATPFAAVAIAAILVLVFAAYLATLHYAGRSLERRRHIISERLT